jgi:hypothetical protein
LSVQNEGPHIENESVLVVFFLRELAIVEFWTYEWKILTLIGSVALAFVWLLAGGPKVVTPFICIIVVLTVGAYLERAERRAASALVFLASAVGVFFKGPKGGMTWPKF